MTEIEALLERQARWQKAREDLSWPEKIKMAEQILPSVAKWRIRERGENRSDLQAGLSGGTGKPPSD